MSKDSAEYGATLDKRSGLASKAPSMTISDSDTKILWGRAAGICSNPTCRSDLTVMLNQNGSYNVGEMAHIIAKSNTGPRGIQTGGPDTYENLILLCPTCHRKIDKAPPGEYTEQMLHDWKDQHEANIRALGQERKFATGSELMAYVAQLLTENKAIWQHFGPESQAALTDPGSNLHLVWTLRKLDRILPNNRRIINSIEANRHLLSAQELAAFLEFHMHATSFEANQYHRLSSYPIFPTEFERLFSQ